MSIPQIYVDEACPLEGYDGLTVRVLANATDAQWKTWAAGTLGTPDCAACQKFSAPARRGRKAAAPAEPMGRRYCPACAAQRAAYGASIVLLYGPTLLGADVSTPDAALALFDRDDALPSELVIWLQLLPGAVRTARVETLMGNLTSSSATPTT